MSLVRAGIAHVSCRRLWPDEDAPYIIVGGLQVDSSVPIPVPEDDAAVVLTVTGAIDNPNDGDQALFDLEALEQLQLIEFTVDDIIFDQELTTFRGVLFSELLDWLRADESASELIVTNSDGATTTIPISDVESYPVLLATSANGQRLVEERGGALRVVYPNRRLDFTPAYNERWLTGVTAIEVRE
jgi:hypothetical protein